MTRKMKYFYLQIFSDAKRFARFAAEMSRRNFFFILHVTTTLFRLASLLVEICKPY